MNLRRRRLTMLNPRLVCYVLAEATLRENGKQTRRSGSGASADFFFSLPFFFWYPVVLVGNNVSLFDRTGYLIYGKMVFRGSSLENHRGNSACSG